MKKNYNNFDDLIKDLEKEVQSVLEREVTEKAKDVMQKNVHSEVYDPSVYTPAQYERKEDEGGLSDKKNMVSTALSGEVGIAFRNVRTNSDNEGGHTGFRDVAEIIEYGLNDEYFIVTKEGKDLPIKPSKNPINNPQGWKKWKPRRFTQATYNELKSTGVHIDALKDGLKKKGFDVRAEEE